MLPDSILFIFQFNKIFSFSVGDPAIITSSKHMSSVTGTVTHKGTASSAGKVGTTLYTVLIEFKNPGAFYSGMEVGGSVNGLISPGK